MTVRVGPGVHGSHLRLVTTLTLITPAGTVSTDVTITFPEGGERGHLESILVAETRQALNTVLSALRRQPDADA